MFTPHKDHRTEYISLYDPAVDDGALTEEQVKSYLEAWDISILPLRPDTLPITWTLAPLDRYTLKYALSTCPGDVAGGLLPEILAYHLCQVGIKGVTNLPEDAPEFSLHKVGLLERVADDFTRSIPPEIAQELGNIIYTLSTVTEATKKKSNSHSAGKKSKKGSPAKAAPRE